VGDYAKVERYIGCLYPKVSCSIWKGGAVEGES